MAYQRGYHFIKLTSFEILECKEKWKKKKKIRKKEKKEDMDDAKMQGRKKMKESTHNKTLSVPMNEPQQNQDSMQASKL